LVGPTGVGKSTWINAFANYCSFESLDAAEHIGGRFPIDFTFELTDQKTAKMISVSSTCCGITPIFDATEVGESVTQTPEEYTFECENIQVTLIDTPGLHSTKDAGTSGHDKDREHVQNILRLLSRYDKIHAICIFMKANETRLNEPFKYTLTEILAHLDKDACNNVIFIFTHAKSKSTATKAILQRFLKDNHIQIFLPPDRQTIYYFENETVQYLAARKNNVEPEIDEDDVTKSWRKSEEATTQMICYVSSLEPLSLQGINAMYDTEWTISSLSRLVVETLTCVFKDKKKLEQKQGDADEIKTEISRDPAAFIRNNLRNLRTFLQDITESKVTRVQLGHTNVVCVGSRCVEEANGEIEYHQICCEACKSPWMYFCSRISWSGKCKRCGCDKSKHEWRTTKTQISAKPTQDGNVETVDSSNVVSVIDRALSAYQDQVNHCKDEAEQMLRTCAHLNTCVRKSALLQRSGDDEMTRILKNKIEAYESFRMLLSSNELKELAFPEKTSDELKAVLAEFRRITDQYKVFSMENVKYKPNDVHDQIQQLYSLPLKGNDMKQAMEVEEKAKNEVVDETPSRIWHLPGCAWRVFSKIKFLFW